MKFALHIGGFNTILGIEKDKEIKFVTVPSKLLFSNAKVFPNRLRTIVEKAFQINAGKRFDSITLSLSGYISKEKLIRSELINRIALNDSFCGYNFVEALKDWSDNIHLIRNIDAYSLGWFNREDIKYPSLLIVKDYDVEFSIIIEDKHDTIVEDIDFTQMASQLNNEAIDDILFSNSSDISLEYSSSINRVINEISEKVGSKGLNLNSVLFISEDGVLIDKSELIKHNPELELKFIELNNTEYSSPINGCFLYPLENREKKFDMQRYLNKALKGLGILNLGILAPPLLLLKQATEIEYWSSNNKKLKSFNSLTELVEHFVQTKPYAYGGNYYKIKFLNKIEINIKLNSIESEKELKKLFS